MVNAQDRSIAVIKPFTPHRVTAFFMLWLCAHSAAQCRRTPLPTAGTGFNDPAGFTIPGLRGATAHKEMTLNACDQPTGLTLNEMTPTPYSVLQGPGPWKQDRPHQVHVYKLWRFSRNKNVFAYAISVACSSLSSNGNRWEAACLSAYIYYDTTGNGRFTTVVPTDLYSVPTPPLWVETK